MRYVFGDYELDEQLYELRRAGEGLKLDRKVFDVLAYLIQHRERLVPKEELLDKLWPEQVVGEAALTRCITAARKALGDDGNRQEFIKTQHGRGYRFVASVEALAPPVASRQQEANQKATREDPEQAAAEPGSLDAAQQNPEEEEKNEPQMPLRSIRATESSRFWPRKSLMLVGVLLLAGTTLIAYYLAWFSLSPQSSALVIEETKPPSLPLPDKPSIAVLPFTNMSGDPEQEYFSDGLTDDLITDLSQISSLFVIARHSTFTYKNKAVKVQDVSRELGVRYVLEGSVRKTNDQVRITAQLVDATMGNHLWSERYDRPLQDIFALQDEIVQQIVTNLRIEVLQAERERVRRIPTENLTAYDLFLRGLEALLRVWNETKKEANAQARQMFEQAIELDPQYAGAYALLSLTYWFDWFSRWSPNPTQSLERALELAQKAVALDDSLFLPHHVLSQVYLWAKRHDQAAAEAERAIALDLNNAEGYHTLGGILHFAGRREEAIRLIKKAMRLNPRYPVSYLNTLGAAYRAAGQ